MFSLTTQAINPETAKKERMDAGAGGYVSFEGWVRDHNEGKSVDALEYDAYDALALTEGQAILDEARQKFPIVGAACIHRTGVLTIGDTAVWIGVSAAHRDAAFQACRYIIDEIKARVPIWKKEHYTDGSADWVYCPACDTAAHPHH